MTSSKMQINEFLTKFLHNVCNLVLKSFCKFQADIPINARVTAVESLENLRIFGRQKDAYPPIFPYRQIHHVKFLAFHGNQLEYNGS